MPVQVFSIPARGCSAGADELNQFLQSRRIVSVERHLVSENGVAYWSFCVEYLERGASSGRIACEVTSRSSKGKIDYREILSESEFVVFAKLRDLPVTAGRRTATGIRRTTGTTTWVYAWL